MEQWKILARYFLYEPPLSTMLSVGMACYLETKTTLYDPRTTSWMSAHQINLIQLSSEFFSQIYDRVALRASRQPSHGRTAHSSTQNSSVEQSKSPPATTIASEL